MMRRSDRTIQWNAAEEVWVNGRGQATVWSGDGQNVHQKTFQLRAPGWGTPIDE
jgi:hypothetical protein